jgi:hypothetical protein
MIANCGPPRKRGAHLEARSSNPTPRFQLVRDCQSLVWAAWQRHALWLLANYSRTGNFKYLLAFARQVHGMRHRLR